MCFVDHHGSGFFYAINWSVIFSPGLILAPAYIVVKGGQCKQAKERSYGGAILFIAALIVQIRYVAMDYGLVGVCCQLFAEIDISNCVFER